MTALNLLDPNPDGHPAVLLLHGLGANASSWKLQLPALTAAGFRPIAPDVPGFGASSYDGRGWTIHRMAAEMAGLIQELGCGPIHVVGLSMGGIIAQQFALDTPVLTRRLILVSTFAVLLPDSLNGWLYFLQRFFLVNTLGQIGGPVGGGADLLESGQDFFVQPGLGHKKTNLSLNNCQ